MMHQFRHLYPQGSIISELIEIDRGMYIVKVAVQNQEIILGTGLAAADTVEKAEDRARERALMTIDLGKTAGNSQLKHSHSEESSIEQSSPAVSPTKTKVVESLKEKDDYDTPAVNLAPSETVINNSLATSEPILEQKLEDFAPPIVSQETTPEISSQTASIEDTQTNIFDQPITPNLEETTPVELEPEKIEEIVELDFNVIKHKTDLEMKRLNWTKEQGRDYLLSTYGKRSRLHLTDEELLEFWRYLETLPN